MSNSSDASNEQNGPLPTLELPNGSLITQEAALDTDKNIVQEVRHVEATKAFYRRLWAERDVMSALVKHHIGLGDQFDCFIAPQHQWIRGNFNVCLPVNVRSPGSSYKLILRCAMPHKLAEAHKPGSMDEKMDCEVGAYAWIQEKCPDIRIPHLYGFGFSDQRHFTHEAHRPLYIRMLHGLRRLYHTLVRRPILLSRYTRHAAQYRFPTAYMLLEDVGSDSSQMLSNTWNKHRMDPVRRRNLFQGISRLMLSLSRVPQPRIGSFQFRDDGTITLTNRPLLCSFMILENEGSPAAMQRETTYESIEPFMADLFNFHDMRFLSHPNMVFDDKDCRGEMAARLLLRMLAHRYVRQDRRNGPFILQLDDFHSSNIFVDTEWNITALIDLEWICALPIERLSVPHWLTNCAIDEIREERWDEFNRAREEFMNIFEAEERKVKRQDGLLSEAMRDTWTSGGVWFWQGMMSINAMSTLFTDHICPRFSTPLSFENEQLLSRFWSEDAAEVVTNKVKQYDDYTAEVRALFEKNTLSP
ncbi:uncharacterized protein VDAG_03977 [Verticillium dahliae VdLs.17]|uniref:Aminoglycoside phosphotransferase domain-containing protein n=1 Tax=Verticillium dahliae (strain VdLs.17 / ATCC MYA-4575 / FGSC 10137) TaxID=498257 RepID=G2X148_VERDV|nr:uncharacterized protein VDAG_03977 [Verticillium dahliae VdLs.17]EGY22539.1 hypothetical protein VDAG_03977 [Verticillium dahliae VdLs.17]KAF3344034.1 hypothetical protein VdG2_08092 [Verticillium dahliae VDG2]KAH6704963.1 hypothetical protein EV126DRAFT_458581 [Verticillium dahliae]